MSLEPISEDGPAGDERMDEPPIVAGRLWAGFRRTRDVLHREELVLAYRFLVDDALAVLAPDRADPDELTSLEERAVSGLEAAIDRFPDDGDPRRFTIYAAARVRAALEDALQRLDWMPRTIRRRRQPGEEPVAPIDDGPREAAAPRPARAGSPEAWGELEEAPYRALARTIGLYGAEGAADPAARVRHALRRLPEQQRTVLTLQFLAGLSLDQVGALLGTSSIGARRAGEHALEALRRAVEEL